MTIAYAPGLLAALASFAICPSLDSARFDLLRCALALHFSKRIFEVVFIHKLSSPMVLDSALVISINHSVSSAILIYTQYLSVNLPEPTLDLKYIGVGLFFVGLCGNSYHNYLLAKLGKEGNSDNGYKVPQGGLFSSVICPQLSLRGYSICGHCGHRADIVCAVLRIGNHGLSCGEKLGH